MLRQMFLWLALLECVSVYGQRGDSAGRNITAELTELRATVKSLTYFTAKLNDTDKRQKSDLEALEARLNATTEVLKEQNAEIEKLMKENEEMRLRLNATEEEIDGLKQAGRDKVHQIAFSAALVKSGEIYKGPCTDRTLVYKRVFCNNGNGYDQTTGVFVAPVKGLYFFTFSAFGYNTHLTGAILVKNGVRQVSTYDDRSADGSDSSSNAAVLRLDVGDQVSTELWEGSRVYDNTNGHTTFSGFLLYAL